LPPAATRNWGNKDAEDVLAAGDTRFAQGLADPARLASAVELRRDPHDYGSHRIIAFKAA